MKIAFFDIDGTLINVANGLLEPTKNTIMALSKFQKQGNKIVIATARGDVPNGLDGINFDGYICSDGHYIRYNGKILVDQLFDESMIQKQMNVYQKYHGKAMFYGHQKSWCACLDDELIVKHRLMFQGTTKRPKNVTENFQASDVKAISCCVLFDNVDDLKEAYQQLKDQFTIVLYETGLIRMDVYCKGFTKGTACKYLYEKLNVAYEDTYAFGDGINDLEMFQLVNHAVAMQNGVAELKAVASEVTESVDDDGIAKFFKRHFKI